MSVTFVFQIGSGPSPLLLAGGSTGKGWTNGDSVFGLAFGNLVSTPDPPVVDGISVIAISYESGGGGGGLDDHIDFIVTGSVPQDFFDTITFLDGNGIPITLNQSAAAYSTTLISGFTSWIWLAPNGDPFTGFTNVTVSVNAAVTGPSILDSILPIFPECPSFGFNAQPQYLLKLNEREGGFENTVKRWKRPLNVYTAVPIGERDEGDIQNILNFWHAMGGQALTFLLKDWLDYKSCPVQDAITALDQPLEIVTLLDSSTAYQLTKVYTVGALTQVREITQPDPATFVVANESGDAQTDYTLDASSGLFKPGSGFTGTPSSWGGEFLVPVRFDSELDLQVADKQIQSVSFTLREKRIVLANAFPGSP